MCFTGKIVQNVNDIIILLVFFPTMTYKYIYHLSERPSFFQDLSFQALETHIFEKLNIFLCLLDLWGFLVIKFGKFPNERRYRE